MLEERNKKYRNIDLVVKNNTLDIHDIIETINNLPSLTPIEERVETLEDDVDNVREDISDLSTSVGNLRAKIENECVSQEEYLETKGTVEALQEASNQHGEAIIALSDAMTEATEEITTNYATKDFVNSSIQTNTATFRGTFDIVDDLQLPTTATNTQIATKLNQVVTSKTNNDYCFVYINLTQSSEYKRFKYNGTTFEYEYTLNNSSFTNQQWAAINSGINYNNLQGMNQAISQNQNDIGDLDDRLAIQEAKTIPTQLSQLSGDSTHRTVTDTEISTWNNKSNFSGNYNDLTNKPTIPSALSQLSQNASYRTVSDTEKATWNAKSNFSGSYNDLSNKPTIPTNLWDLNDNSTHRLVTDAEKTTWNNKSNFSGSYNDLTDKPTIPGVTHLYEHTITLYNTTISTPFTLTISVLSTSNTTLTTLKAIRDVIGANNGLHASGNIIATSSRTGPVQRITMDATTNPDLKITYTAYNSATSYTATIDNGDVRISNYGTRQIL